MAIIAYVGTANVLPPHVWRVRDIPTRHGKWCVHLCVGDRKSRFFMNLVYVTLQLTTTSTHGGDSIESHHISQSRRLPYCVLLNGLQRNETL